MQKMATGLSAPLQNHKEGLGERVANPFVLDWA
jgi:hypothetical protein